MNRIQGRPFKYLRQPQAPEGLVLGILEAIGRERLRTRRALVAAFGALSAGSLALTVAAYLSVSQAFASTGFWQYASLMLSDISSLGTYWQELVLLLAETLPFLNIAAMLAAVFLFLWSLGSMMRSMRRMRPLRIA
jgi:hypothetical protein